MSVQMDTSVLDDPAKAKVYYDQQIEIGNRELAFMEVGSPERTITTAHLHIFEELQDIVNLGLPKLRR